MTPASAASSETPIASTLPSPIATSCGTASNALRPKNSRACGGPKSRQAIITITPSPAKTIAIPSGIPTPNSSVPE